MTWRWPAPQPAGPNGPLSRYEQATLCVCWLCQRCLACLLMYTVSGARVATVQWPLVQLFDFPASRVIKGMHGAPFESVSTPPHWIKLTKCVHAPIGARKTRSKISSSEIWRWSGSTQAIHVTDLLSYACMSHIPCGISLSCVCVLQLGDAPTMVWPLGTDGAYPKPLALSPPTQRHVTPK